jgi:hypothetical protein
LREGDKSSLDIVITGAYGLPLLSVWGELRLKIVARVQRPPNVSFPFKPHMAFG